MDQLRGGAESTDTSRGNHKIHNPTPPHLAAQPPPASSGPAEPRLLVPHPASRARFPKSCRPAVTPHAKHRHCPSSHSPRPPLGAQISSTLNPRGLQSHFWGRQITGWRPPCGRGQSQDWALPAMLGDIQLDNRGPRLTRGLLVPAPRDSVMPRLRVDWGVLLTTKSPERRRTRPMCQRKERRATIPTWQTPTQKPASLQ